MSLSPQFGCPCPGRVTAGMCRSPWLLIKLNKKINKKFIHNALRNKTMTTVMNENRRGGEGGSWDWWSCDANKLFTDKLLLAKTEQDIYLILIHYSKQSLDFACERRHLWIIIFRHVIWIAFVHYLFKDFKRWKGDKSVSKILEKLWSEFKVDLHKYKYHMSINPRTLNWNTDL